MFFLFVLNEFLPTRAAGPPAHRARFALCAAPASRRHGTLGKPSCCLHPCLRLCKIQYVLCQKEQLHSSQLRAQLAREQLQVPGEPRAWHGARGCANPCVVPFLADAKQQLPTVSGGRSAHWVCPVKPWVCQCQQALVLKVTVS